MKRKNSELKKTNKKKIVKENTQSVLRSRRDLKKSNKHSIIFFAFIGVVLLLLASVIVIYTQFTPVVEKPATEVKKIPPDVKLAQTLTPTPISSQIRVPILLYHYVEYVQDKRDTIRQSLNINPYAFEQQVKTLSDAGFTFMTASELADVLDGKKKLPPKPVLLTFDDGHWDLYTDVLPILEKYHAKATAYIISSFIGGSDFLSSDQLQQVINSGLVEIGDHTVHHIALAYKLLPVVTYEVNASKEMLENTYHLKIVSFAYPNGSFDQQAIDVVKAAGFKTAVSTVPGIMQSQVNRYYLFRLRPGYRTGEQLLNYLQQATFSAYPNTSTASKDSKD